MHIHIFLDHRNRKVPLSFDGFRLFLWSTFCLGRPLKFEFVSGIGQIDRSPLDSLSPTAVADCGIEELCWASIVNCDTPEPTADYQSPTELPQIPTGFHQAPTALTVAPYGHYQILIELFPRSPKPNCQHTESAPAKLEYRRRPYHSGHHPYLHVRS